MKRIIIISVLGFLFSGFNKIEAQKYISNRQSYYDAASSQEVYLNQSRSILINGNKFEIELLDKTILKGTITALPVEYVNGKKVIPFKTDKDCILAIYPDMIFLNLFATDKIAISYYLENYAETTPDDKRKADAITEYKLNVESYGKFSADCIKEGKVKPGMNGVAALLILGVPNTINQTETINGLTEQLVYEDQYVYIENGIVKTIQRRIEIK